MYCLTQVEPKTCKVLAAWGRQNTIKSILLELKRYSNICILVLQLNLIDESGYLFLWHFVYFLGTFGLYNMQCNQMCQENKHLIIGPKGNGEFLSPRPSMFPEVKPRGTLRSRGNETHCFRWGLPWGGRGYSSYLSIGCVAGNITCVGYSRGYCIVL